MRLGVTGTREGASELQKLWLADVFDQLTIHALHHGACVGVDELAHVYAMERQIPIVVHPPTNPKLVAKLCLTPHTSVTVLPAKPYLHRDRDICATTKGLLALPKEDKEPPPLAQGGTWFTVNYMLRLNKMVILCYPDGRIEKRNVRR